MKCLTIFEFENWCERKGINAPLAGAVGFKKGKNYRVITETPTSARMKKAILRELFGFYEKESDFFVHLREWNILSQDDGIVDLIFALRRQHGESRPLSEAPVHFFTAEEVELCLGFLDIVLAFDWEAVWFPCNCLQCDLGAC